LRRTPSSRTLTSNLGNALYDLSQRESRTTTLGRAVVAFEAALLERTRERVPLDWAGSRHGLANSLESLAEREDGMERQRAAIVAMGDAAELFAEGGVDYWLPVAEESLERMRAQLVEMEAKGAG
jgi:hypothetical protein